MNQNIIFNFNKCCDIQDWIIVDDVVMGGKSSSQFSVKNDGMGCFEGNVSLENNGGFSSVRYRFPKKSVSENTKIILSLKGDGKDYQFRIKTHSGDYYSYIASFSTTGAIEMIEIPLKKMYPSFRGKSLDLPNFDNDYIEEIAFLIGNKKEEKFKLLIDKIVLE